MEAAKKECRVERASQQELQRGIYFGGCFFMTCTPQIMCVLASKQADTFARAVEGMFPANMRGLVLDQFHRNGMHVLSAQPKSFDCCVAVASCV